MTKFIPSAEAIAFDAANFSCYHCEQNLPQSPTWEEYCVYCCITFLEADIEINKEAAKNAG